MIDRLKLVPSMREARRGPRGWMDGRARSGYRVSFGRRSASRVLTGLSILHARPRPPLQSVDGRDDDVRTGVSVRCHLNGGSGGLGDGDGDRARRLASVWDVRCPNDGMCRQAVCLGNSATVSIRTEDLLCWPLALLLPAIVEEDFPVVILWRSRDLKVESTNPSRGLNTPGTGMACMSHS
jgi:hypothetical protein